jgi:hypothetical protein
MMNRFAVRPARCIERQFAVRLWSDTEAETFAILTIAFSKMGRTRQNRRPNVK